MTIHKVLGRLLKNAIILNKNLSRCHLVNCGFRAMVKRTKLTKKKFGLSEFGIQNTCCLLKNASCIAHAHTERSKNIKIIKKYVIYVFPISSQKLHINPMSLDRII